MYIIKLLKYDIKHIVYAIFCSVMIMANCSNCLCSTSIRDVIAGGKFKRANLAQDKHKLESPLIDSSERRSKEIKNSRQLYFNCLSKCGALASSGGQNGVIFLSPNKNCDFCIATPGYSHQGINQFAAVDKSEQQEHASKGCNCGNNQDVPDKPSDDASNVDQENASGAGAIQGSNPYSVQKVHSHVSANTDVSETSSDDALESEEKSKCNKNSSHKIEISTPQPSNKSNYDTSVICGPPYNYFNNDILNKSMYIDNMRGLVVNIHNENEMISDFVQYDCLTSLKIGAIFIPRFTFSIYSLHDLYSGKTGYDEIIDSKKNAIQNVKAGIVKRDSPAPVIRNRSSSLVKRNVQLSVKKIILELKNNKNISDKEILYAIRKLAILKTKYRDKNSRMYVNKIIKKLQELRKPLLQNNKCVGLNVKRKVYENGDIFAS